MTATIGRALVPDTGQTTCWDADGAPRPCTGTGEDGDLQAGVAWPTARFVDNLDGTVTDSLTGLSWLKDANCPTFQGASGEKTWQGALDWVVSFNSGSTGCTHYTAMTFTDWRLPNIKELSSLVDYSQEHPALPSGHMFVNVRPPGTYWTHWSSTTSITYPTHAWGVALGALGDAFISHKADAFLVWSVRGGQ